MSAATVPWITIRPRVGAVMPASSLSSVLLPAPLRPMTPTAPPRHVEADLLERPSADWRSCDKPSKHPPASDRSCSLITSAIVSSTCLKYTATGTRIVTTAADTATAPRSGT